MLRFWVLGTVPKVRDCLLIFWSEAPQNPCPLNIIFLKCLILQDKTIFKDIKLENFNSIETFFFDLQKFDILFMP